MARQPRLVLPGVALHVVQRGNNRSACFDEVSDYLCYLANLRKLSAKYGCVVHAYCLMTNHVHVLMTPRSFEDCRNLMRDLGNCHVHYFNRRYGRTGTLWEGRYRSCLVESARYVLACYRYIELNPVRARIVDDPRRYAWSSHLVNGGIGEDILATPHPEYLALADVPDVRFVRYRELFAGTDHEADADAIRDATQGGLPLCSDRLRLGLAAEGRKVTREKPGPRAAMDEPQEEQLKIVL